MTDEWRPEDGMDLVFVESVHSPTAASTVAIGEGVRRRDDRLVTFAGDWPPMLELAQVIRDTGDPDRRTEAGSVKRQPSDDYQQRTADALSIPRSLLFESR
jgi:hypothetical protein